MKGDNGCGMVPVLTTQAGCCLTADNWQEVGIEVASFYLSSLLMKPGYECLKSLTDLASHVGWHKTLVLNASLPLRLADNLYPVRSVYDGSRMAYSATEVMLLIEQLQPDTVILPEGLGKDREALWRYLPEAVFPFIPVADLSQYLSTDRPHGVYFSYDSTTTTTTDLLQRLKQFEYLPRYVAGDLSLSFMQGLISRGVQFMETDAPAKDASLGKVYCSEGEISLQDIHYATEFSVIDSNCQCPTCLQQLSRAYLHHLYEHTPLLCQRFLIQHNIFYCLNLNKNSDASFTPE